MEYDQPKDPEDRSFAVPLNGIQLFEVTNLDSSTRKISIRLYASRFIMLESERTDSDEYQIHKIFKPNESFVFGVKDKGHIEKIVHIISNSFEGTLRVEISTDPYVEGENLQYSQKQNCYPTDIGFRNFRIVSGIDPKMEELPRWEIKTDPETNSYREYREWKDRLSDCYGGPDGHDPCEKLVLAIGKEKYGEAELREKIHKISEEDRMGNEKMEELIATDIREGNGKDEIGIRIKNIKMRSMKELQDVIDKEKVATWDLMEALGFKKQKKVEEEPDVEPKPEKSKSKEPEEPKKERSKKSKISETPKPIKSTNCPPKIEPKNVKNPVQKIEISKAQDVQKPQEVVVIQKTSQEEEGKKKKKTKKKKKKRCIIS